MDSNSTQLCRVCLQNSDDLVNVFDEFENVTIASILVEHFWFQVHKNDGMTEWLCQICWIQIKTFHIFYGRIEFLHANYCSSNLIKKEQTVSPKDEGLEFDLNIVKCEETKLTEVVDICVRKEDSSDCDNAKDCDERENCQTSDDDHQSSNEKPKRVIDISVTGKQTLTTNITRKRDKAHRRSEKDKQNAQIREYFSMKCELCCDVEFETLLKAKQHYRKVHNTDGYIVCCGKKFQRRAEILYHIRRHVNSDITDNRSEMDKQDAQIREFFSMKCEICNDVEFETFLKARQHYRKVHKTDGYIVCCGRKHYVRHKIMNHILRHVNPDAYRCDQCGKCFTKEQTLKDHIDNHAPRDSRAHKCSLCSSSFTKATRLKVHVENIHSAKTGEMFPCERCNKKFPSKLLLTCHIRYVHESSVKPVCEICARQFQTKLTLQNHIKVKHSTTPLPKVQCNICGAWSKNKASLLRHIKLHGRNEDDLVYCPICKKAVKDKRLLTGHIRIAHGERNHRCTLCDKAFRTAILLKEHIASHTGEDLYDCSFCEKKFKSNANMYSHRKKAHLTEWTQYKEKKRMD